MNAIEQIPEDTPIEAKQIILMALPILLVLGYGIYCIKKKMLPRGKDFNKTVLFIIDAEDDKQCQKLRKNLVESLCEYRMDKDSRIEALCISKDKLGKIDLQKKDDVLKLLLRTNSIFMIRVHYRADSEDNAENFEMRIAYGVVHPLLTKAAQQTLLREMPLLSTSIKKKNFQKNELIETFNYTTLTLSYIMRYIIGLVKLFSNENENAYTLFDTLATEIKATDRGTSTKLWNMMHQYYFIACMMTVRDLMGVFDKEESIYAIVTAKDRLEVANSIIPNTYDYFVNMAYCLVLLREDVQEARCCIKRCKEFKGENIWKYSDAFLTAYVDGSTAQNIINKYKKALKYDADINRIIRYIEYIQRREPDRIAMLLAAGILYCFIGDTDLAIENLRSYIEKIKGDKKSCQVVLKEVQSLNLEISKEWSRRGIYN